MCEIEVGKKSLEGGLVIWWYGANPNNYSFTQVAIYFSTIIKKRESLKEWSDKRSSLFQKPVTSIGTSH